MCFKSALITCLITQISSELLPFVFEITCKARKNYVASNSGSDSALKLLNSARAYVCARVCVCVVVVVHVAFVAILITCNYLVGSAVRDCSEWI